MGQRRGLGKGLEALIPVTEEPTAGLTEVPVATITPNPMQPRTALDAEARAAGVTAVIGMGASPGVTNLLAARAVAPLDRVDDLFTGCRILLLDGRHPLSLQIDVSAGTAAAGASTASVAGMGPSNVPASSSIRGSGASGSSASTSNRTPASRSTTWTRISPSWTSTARASR